MDISVITQSGCVRCSWYTCSLRGSTV